MAKLTKLERAVVRTKAAALRAHERVEAARAALGDACTHPAEQVQPHRWEHDNGYGRQRWHEGLWCSLCFAIDHWKDGRWMTFEQRMKAAE